MCSACLCEKVFFWHLKSGACFSKVSENGKISNLMINELFFFFICSFWMKRSSLQTRIFRHIYPLFLDTDYETFTGLLRKGPFHHKVTLKQEWYRTWQDRSNSRIRIKVLRMWRFVLKVVWYQEDAKPFNQIYVQNILKWRQHFLPRLEWYKEIINIIR